MTIEVVHFLGFYQRFLLNKTLIVINIRIEIYVSKLSILFRNILGKIN